MSGSPCLASSWLLPLSAASPSLCHSEQAWAYGASESVHLLWAEGCARHRQDQGGRHQDTDKTKGDSIKTEGTC